MRRSLSLSSSLPFSITPSLPLLSISTKSFFHSPPPSPPLSLSSWLSLTLVNLYKCTVAVVLRLVIGRVTLLLNLLPLNWHLFKVPPPVLKSVVIYIKIINKYVCFCVFLKTQLLVLEAATICYLISYLQYSPKLTLVTIAFITSHSYSFTSWGWVAPVIQSRWTILRHRGESKPGSPAWKTTV